MKNTKKMLPLVVLVIVMAVLVVLLAVLQRGDDTTDATLPLCNFAVEDIDRPPTRATTRCDVGQKQPGDWMRTDPTLPLDQTKTASLVESYANLTAQRKLEGSDLTDLPEKRALPPDDHCHRRGRGASA